MTIASDQDGAVAPQEHTSTSPSFEEDEVNELSDGDMPTISDESIEEVYRPEFDELKPKRPSKWSLVDDGLRKRGRGDDGCCSGGGCGLPRQYEPENDDDIRDLNRRTWLTRFLLLLMVLPAIPMLLVGWEFFMASQMAVTLGLQLPPRERLEAFYRDYNPGKLNEYTIQKTLRKWEGRYDQLFKALEKKYADKPKADTKRSRRRH